MAPSLMRFYAEGERTGSPLTAQWNLPSLSAMELQLPQRQAEQLLSLASRTGRSPDELVVDAVDRMLAHESWFAAQVQLGVDQIARGEVLDEEQMDARVTRMIRA